MASRQVRERLRLGAELDAIREQAGAQRSGQFLNAMTHYCQAAMEGGELDLADRLLSWIEETVAQLRQPTTVGYAKLRLANRGLHRRPARGGRAARSDAYQLCARAGSRTPRRSTPATSSASACTKVVWARWSTTVGRCAERFPGIRVFVGRQQCARPRPATSNGAAPDSTIWPPTSTPSAST